MTMQKQIGHDKGKFSQFYQKGIKMVKRKLSMCITGDIGLPCGSDGKESACSVRDSAIHEVAIRHDGTTKHTYRKQNRKTDST